MKEFDGEKFPFELSLSDSIGIAKIKAAKALQKDVKEFHLMWNQLLLTNEEQTIDSLELEDGDVFYAMSSARSK